MREDASSCLGKGNAENIGRLSDFASQIAENVLELAENLDEKFFMVTSELNSIKQAQHEMILIQNSEKSSLGCLQPLRILPPNLIAHFFWIPNMKFL